MTDSVPGLRHEILLPESEGGGLRHGAPVAVLLHGRGADRHDLAGLAPHLPRGVMLVTPEAPHPGRPWGYGPGWAWYRYRGDDRVDPSSLARSVAALDAFLHRLPELLPVRPGPVLVGGFSQGGTTSLVHALAHPERSEGVAVLSGFLPHVDDRDEPAPEASELRVFWGHGTGDAAVPHALAVRGREALTRRGIDVTAHDHAAGHTITVEEMGALAAWLEAGDAGWSPADIPETAE